MVEVLLFFSKYAVLIYLLLLLALVFALRHYTTAHRERKEAVFGLEIEQAQRKENQAISALTAIVLLALAEMVLAIFLVPALPANSLVSFPTEPAGQPVNTMAPALLGTLGAETPQPTFTLGPAGCIPGQVMITSPKPGEQVRGRITLEGTADIPDFGFYKYEFSQVGTDIWTTVQAGRDVKHEEDLGDWDTSELTSGDYLLRLVVSDNEGRELPACIVPIRILPP